MTAYNKTSSVDEGPTTELYLPTIMNLNGCRKHNAQAGDPCFKVPKLKGWGYHPGICNSRALKSGFNAPIDPRSLTQRKAFGRAA